MTEIETKTSAKVGVRLGERPTPKFTEFLSRFFPSIKDNIMRDKQFNIYAGDKKVGDAEIYKEGEDSLNVVWVGIDKSERGNGYASAVMRGIVHYAQKEGFKQVTLEVPGNSPDARHIYEKLGFKVTKVLSNPDEDVVWGGLTAMKLTL